MTYSQPAQIHTIELTIQNSRFICTTSYAESVQEAREFIQTIKTQFPNASHHVYAYRIGFGNSIVEGMSDDGEPSGTAAPPTLAVLRGSGIGDIVLVTTRYFGGTKLGTGGLVRAYSDAAKENLASLVLKLNIKRVGYQIIANYSQYNVLKRCIIQHNATLVSELFEDIVQVELELEETEISSFLATLNDVFNDRIVIYPTTNL